MTRIKITGYLDSEELPPEFVDAGDHTGLSAEGFEQITTDEGFPVWKIADLGDLTVEVEDE